jgi:hypothetical protein
MKRSFAATGPSSLVLSEVLVAERYLSDADPLRADALTRLLRAGDGRLRHALFLPGDETYFAVYDSTSVDAVHAASAVDRARHVPDRIVPALLLVPGRRSA